MHLGILQSLACKAGLHAFSRPRRVKGFKVRRCAACRLRQVEQFPGATWLTEKPAKRVRRAVRPYDPEDDREVFDADKVSRHL